MKTMINLPTHCNWWSMPNGHALAETLAASVAQTLESAMGAGERCSLAVSGGSTPERFLSALSRQNLDWSRVDLCLVDERWVAPVEPDSNEGMVREVMAGTAMAAATFYVLKTPAELPGDAVMALQERFTAFHWPLDVCVLGMGEDGHTASLFPGMPELSRALDASAPTFVPVPAGLKGPARLSMSAAPLLAARRCILHIEGHAKYRTLQEVCEQRNTHAHPVWAVLERRACDILWAPA